MNDIKKSLLLYTGIKEGWLSSKTLFSYAYKLGKTLTDVCVPTNQVQIEKLTNVF